MAPHPTSFGHTHEAAGFDPATRARQPYSPQDCPPPCPACGGLECLCRPRFFPGQLLTDEDLNRLDHYIVQKNRLHNRYLHGHGVVCGLEVITNPCNSQSVIVKQGYALSPCGDDIIVCKDTAVNICDLLSRCRPQSQVECDPTHSGPVELCPEETREWVLAICYDEKPSRGVAALRADVSGSCCPQCGSGSTGNCGCGSGQMCNGNGYAKRSVAPTQTKKRIAQCEPTVVCETYKFIVYRHSETARVTNLNKEFLAKFKAFQDEWPRFPSENATFDELDQFDSAFQAGALNFALRQEWADVAGIKRALEAIPTKQRSTFANGPAAYMAYIVDRVTKMALAVAPILSTEFCQLLKPACPLPVQRNCVPLATITVHRKDHECQVKRICNFDVRELALTAPLIEFWFADAIRKWKASLKEQCCPTKKVVPPIFLTPMFRKRMALFEEAGETDADRGRRRGEILAKTLAQPDRHITSESVILALLGAQDEQGRPLISDAELLNPVTSVLFFEVVRPVIQDLLPTSLVKSLEAISKTEELDNPGLPTVPVKIQQLEQQMTSLQEAIEGQQRLISKLTTKLERLKQKDDR